ncbi:MAG: hypothetical protein HeimC2_38890 [Candidatus Heimdallarchaeota archaeon LC_2]|nr:MAG: hypothetical protein HeimC2_38890 [Candidatus Heimdallarchaeota archaeon LC_2]
MTEIAHFIYKSNAPIETSDNYFLQIKAHIEFNAKNNEKLQSTINSSSMKFFKSLSLFEALKLLEDIQGEVYMSYYNTVKDNCLTNHIEIKKFILTTIDAVQINSKVDQINVEINPELEGKKKKRGLFGKLFGK